MNTQCLLYKKIWNSNNEYDFTDLLGGDVLNNLQGNHGLYPPGSHFLRENWLGADTWYRNYSHIFKARTMKRNKIILMVSSMTIQNRQKSGIFFHKMQYYH